MYKKNYSNTQVNHLDNLINLFFYMIYNLNTIRTKNHIYKSYRKYLTMINFLFLDK